MQRHAPTQTLAQRVRTLVGSFAVLLIGTAFYSQNVRAQTLPGSNIPATASYSCDFENTYCDFHEQSKVASTGGHRSSIVASAASGTRGVKLTTLVGDSAVNGSGTWERNDLMKPKDASYCQPGQEEWWAFSIMFPDDYVFPPGPDAGIIMDFHHSGSSGQANYEIQTIPGIGLRARGYGGAAVNTGKYDALIADPYGATANITKNQWYHFVLHVRWSPNGDGLMEGWLNGKKYQSYQGATLYAGQTCYLKLANYHGPFGQASSIIHDRVVRGVSAADVTHLALEGVAGTGVPTQAPAPTSYALSTITMGSGTGTVTSSPSGINCGSSCSSAFAPNSAVTLTATPAAGSAFAGWTGACSGTGACTVTMNGAKSATATFTAGTPQSNPVPAGSGVGLSASTLYFKSGVQSTASVTYTNNTASTVQFLQASMSSGKYQQTNNCDAVAPGQSCTATVTYYPSNSGTEAATFTVTSNAPNSPHLVTLTTAAETPAAATNAVVVSASTLSFGATQSTQTVTFTNKTSKTVQFIRATMSSGKFQQTNDCDAVAPGASCQARVTYYPSNSGSTNGTLTVTSDAPNSPHVITLKGNSSKPRVVA